MQISRSPQPHHYHQHYLLMTWGFFGVVVFGLEFYV